MTSSTSKPKSIHFRHISKKIKTRRRKQSIAILYHAFNIQEKGQYFSREHEIMDRDTVNTVKAIKQVLKNRGYKTQEIKVNETDISALKNIKSDYIFNLADSKAMEIKIAGILERLHIPYSGSASDAIRNGNNKIRTKMLFTKNNIPTPGYIAVVPGLKITRAMLPSKFPLIIKPAFEHGSISVSENSVITTFKRLQTIIKVKRRKVKQTLICEEFIKGREIQILVLERHGQTIAFPPAELISKGKYKSKWNIYGFKEKWKKRSEAYKNLIFIAPPKSIPEQILYKMERDAIKAFYALNFKDYARFDIRYNPKIKKWYFLEGNPNPGLSVDPTDAATASMLASGLSFDDFIIAIIHNSLLPISGRIRRNR